MFWVKRFFKSFTVYTVCFSLSFEGVLGAGGHHYEPFDSPAYGMQNLGSVRVEMGDQHVAETDVDHPDTSRQRGSVASHQSWTWSRADYTPSLKDKPTSETTLNDLAIEVRRIRAVEDTWRHQVRWVYLSWLAHRMLYATFLRYPKTEGGHRPHPLKEPLLQEDQSPSFEMANPKPLWVHGRGFPLTEHDQKKIYALNSTIEGFEAVAVEGVHLLFLGLMVSQLGYSIKDGQNFFDVFKLLFVDSDDNSVRNLYNIGNPVPHAEGLWALAAIPFLWAFYRGIKTYREGTEEHFEEALESLKKAKTGIYPDFFRWFAGCYETRHALHVLNRTVFDDRIKPDERDRILDEIHDFAQKHGGRSRMNAFHSLYNVVDGVSTRNFHLLDQETQDDLLKNKALALHYLMQAAHKPFQKAFRSYGVHFMTQGLPAFYARYLLWTLGQCEGVGENLGWLGVRAAKSALTILLFKAIIEGILDILDCPQKQGVTWAGPTDWASDYSEQCFNAYVQQFNQVPGQPAHTLTDLFPKFRFVNPYISLDLSNKGINGTVIAQILQGLRSAQPRVRITNLDLSQNAIGASSSQDTMDLAGELRYWGEALTSLNVSGNFIGSTDSAGITKLGRVLENLPLLKIFDVSGNPLGTQNDGLALISSSFGSLTQLAELYLSTLFKGIDPQTGQLDFVEGPNYSGPGLPLLTTNLQKLPKIKKLSFAFNFFGGLKKLNVIPLIDGVGSLESLTYLNFQNNFLGNIPNAWASFSKPLCNLKNLKEFSLFDNPLSTAMDQSQFFAFTKVLACATQLTSLNLADNGIPSSYGPYLGAAVQKMQSLRSLDLKNNHIPITPFITRYAPQVPMPFWFDTPADLDTYLSELPSTVTNLSLANSLPTKLTSALPFVNVLIKYFQRFKGLQELNMSGNFIGAQDPQAVNILAKNIGLLKNLRILNLAACSIGYNGLAQSTALMLALQSLATLESLNLSANRIGSTSPDDLLQLAETLKKLRSLKIFVGGDLSLQKIAPAAFITFLESFGYVPTLQELSLAKNSLGDNSQYVQALGSSLKNLNLAYLSLAQNNIGRDTQSLLALAQGLRHQTRLKTLYLSNNLIGSTGPEGPAAVVDAISYLLQHGNLTHFNIAGMTNISWSTAQSQLQTLTNRKLKEQCESQLCHATDVHSVSIHDVAGGDRRREVRDADRLEDNPPVLFEPLTNSASRPQVFGPLMAVYKVLSGVTQGVRDLWGSAPSSSFRGAASSRDVESTFKASCIMEDFMDPTLRLAASALDDDKGLFAALALDGEGDIGHPEEAEASVRIHLERERLDSDASRWAAQNDETVPQPSEQPTMREIFNRTTTPMNVALGAAVALYYGKQIYDGVRGWLYPLAAPVYASHDYADPELVSKTLKRAKKRIDMLKKKISQGVRRDKTNWILEDALMDINAACKSLLNQPKVLKTTFKDFKDDLTSLCEGVSQDLGAQALKMERG